MVIRYVYTLNRVERDENKWIPSMESSVEWCNIEKPEENFNNSADPLLWKSGTNVTICGDNIP